MTANDAATLLRTYADALETTHPMPVEQTDLTAMFVGVDEEPISVLELEAPEAPPHPSIGRLIAVAFGLAAAIALLVGYALLNDDDDVRTADIPDGGGSSLVFPGETVLSEDPLVVTVAAPVEPTFDTSELGERFQLTGIESLGDPGVKEFLDRLSRSENGESGPATVVKTTLLGRDGAEPTAIHVADLEDGIDGQDAVLRMRWLASALGANGGGDSLPQGDELFMLRTPETFADFTDERGGFSFGSDRIAGNADPTRIITMIDVSLDVAVLQYVTNGEPTWTVPIAGVAVLPTWLNEESVVEVFLYSDSGEQIYPR